jgi:hypothetical protein
MHQIQNWDKSNLQEYLLYDTWDIGPALNLLAGFDYLGGKAKELGEYPALDQSILVEYKSVQENHILDELDANATRLRNFWRNSNETREKHPPSFFIEWALSKKFRPPWLDWAIEHKLYEQEQEASQNKTGTITPTTTYSTKWLEIQQAAILEFFSPRQEVDAKQAVVVSWIESEAKKAGIKDPTNVATVMFTIIKPEDHSPKIRRAGPIKTQQP